MDDYTVKRLALVLAKQAEIEGMKAENAQYPDDQRYNQNDFAIKAEELRQLAYMHNEQL